MIRFIKENQRGITNIAAIASVCACVGSFIAPVIYVSDIKAVNSVQAEQISTLKDNYKSIDTKLDEIIGRIDKAQIK